MPDDELPDDLAERWYEYWRLRSGSKSERDAIEQGRPAAIRYAYDYVEQLVEQGGEPAVGVLVLLAEAAPPGDDGLTVGVGPLERLLTGYDRATMELVALAARRSPSFARAVQHAVMPPDV